jgi:hypothetical protein
MISVTNDVKIVFPEGFDERSVFEMPYKGWVSIDVILQDGSRYSLFLIDPVRLQQDLDECIAEGAPCFAEPGLIVLPELTTKAVEDTVQFLWRQGFFNHLKPHNVEISDTKET